MELQRIQQHSLGRSQSGNQRQTNAMLCRPETTKYNGEISHLEKKMATLGKKHKHNYI